MVHRSTDSLNFFLDQTENFKNKLETAEQELKVFKSVWNISSIEKQRKQLLEMNANIKSEIDKTDIELARLQQKVDSTKNLLTGIQNSFTDSDITNPSQVIDSLKLKLIDLKLKKIDMSLKYSDDTIFITSVDKEINDIERELEKEEVKSSVFIDIVSLESKKEKLTNLLNKSNEELNKINLQEFELRDIKRRVGENEELYSTYFKKTEEVRISQSMDLANITNVKVTEPAYIPIQSIRLIDFIPQKIFNILAAFLMGIFGGLSLISLLEIFDHSFKSADNAEEYLNLPVLGIISESDYFAAKTGFFQRWKR
jgi:uncharacterized protein involved in exopolysaccharide biosynthesis